ncbi:MAG: TraU family protein [Nitrospirota bacterium]
MRRILINLRTQALKAEVLKSLVCFGTVVLQIFSTSSAYAVDITSLASALNVKSCLEYKVAGPCWLDKKKLLPGINMCYWSPVLLIETPRQPFSSSLSIVNTLLEPLKEASSLFGGAGGASSFYQTNSFYHEAHVVTFSFLGYIKNPVQAIFGLCKKDLTLPYAVNYLSEVDIVNWRTGAADYFTFKWLASATAGASQICSLSGIPLIGDAISVEDACMGTWGATYPRTGLMIANSSAVASAATCFRAVSVASKPFVTGRVGFIPLHFQPTQDDKLQMVFPRSSGCIKIGQSPASWDFATALPPEVGGYIWVYWRKVCCCVTPGSFTGVPLL